MTTFRIRGMKCQHCAAATKKALEALGATDVQIDLTTGEAKFEGHLDRESARQAIAAQGFELAD